MIQRVWLALCLATVVGFGCQGAGETGGGEGKGGMLAPGEERVSSGLSQCGPKPATPECNRTQCVDGGWDTIPLPAGTPCSMGGVCDGGAKTGIGRCQPVPASRGVVTPLFYITHVLYSVPGESSSVTYSRGNTFGSATSTTKSHNTDVNVKASISVHDGLFTNSEFEIKGGKEWGSSREDTTDITVESTADITKPGQTDVVNHDDDEIWFVMNPRMDVKVEKFPDITNVTWSFSPDQTGARVFFVTVKDLKDLMNGMSLGPRENIRNELNRAGIGPESYPQLLHADPFANNSMMMPMFMVDQNRYGCVGSYPYVPVNRPDGNRTEQNVSISRNKVITNMESSDETYSVGFTVTGAVGFAEIFRATLSVDSTWTWTSSSSKTLTTGVSTTESFKILQPAFDYAGPPRLSVFVDRIYKSYLFNLDTGCDM
jgi:hypothetical protein